MNLYKEINNCIEQFNNFKIIKYDDMDKTKGQYCNPTDISLNICEIIHKTILTKFKNINKGKICHLFGHGTSLNKIKTINKNKNDIFASTNKIFKHDILKDLLDYYFTGDGFRYDNNYNKWIDYKLNRKNQKIFKNLNINIKDYINKIKSKTTIFLQVGENNSYHKYHGFDDEGIFWCLKNNYIPIMRKLNGRISDDIINCGMAHPTTFALLHFLVYTGCDKIYLYGQDCSSKYFFEKNKKDRINKYYLRFWKNVKKDLKILNSNVEIINVNSEALKNTFPTIISDKIIDS